MNSKNVKSEIVYGPGPYAVYDEEMDALAQAYKNCPPQSHMKTNIITYFKCDMRTARHIWENARKVAFFSIVPGSLVENDHPYVWCVSDAGHYYHVIDNDLWCTGPFPNIYAAKAHALECDFRFDE